MKVDFIIIGQGIAGTCFAFELLQKNKTFIIIDKQDDNTPSKVALGIYNPLILKWFTKPWHIDHQISFFYKFFNSFQSFFCKNIMFDTGIYKFLKTPYDQNTWLTKSMSPKRKKYMSSELFKLENKSLIYNEFYGLVKSAGRIDIPLFLKTFRNFCITNKCIVNELFNYDHLTIKKDHVKYNDITSSNIIFCEGPAVINNPFFNWIKLKPTKGDLLHIKCKNLNLDKILHASLLFIPLGGEIYSIGATYDWSQDDTLNTSNARERIISIFEKNVNLPYTIIDQKSGIRPSTFDRRAFVGSHPDHSNVYILNGLGTRGILLAPYLSNNLIDSIYFKKNLLKEVSINRAYK
ncbi:MAG: hypothetical protein CMD27_00985 [Flavobacteriales bacterium]|nr:hypothetical protein [Flavobacteriales bacterium]|tara:strand:- start:67 stop:1113 length:1047 start_codon:yes stop_codon:yes gene_type:complete